MSRIAGWLELLKLILKVLAFSLLVASPALIPGLILWLTKWGQ